MKTVVYDLEATCWEDSRNNVLAHEVIEIGAVKLDEAGNLIDEFAIFVRPTEQPILSDFCKELTSIQQCDVDNAVEFSEAMKLFGSWLGKTHCMVGSWGWYDKRQIEHECMRKRTEYPFWTHNVISLKHQYPIVSGNKRCGMVHALKKLNIPFEGVRHRGIDDARNIAKIYRAYMGKWDAYAKSNRGIYN